MYKSLAATACVAVMASVAVAEDDVCTPGHIPDCNLYLKGTFLVHAVDEKRVLVAIDIHNEGTSGDGRVDHLFLITALERRERMPEGILRTLTPGALSILSDAKRIELKPLGDAAHSLPLTNVNWSHYWGYGTSGMKIADLPRAKPADKCDHVAGSCWRIDGSSMNFPS